MTGCPGAGGFSKGLKAVAVPLVPVQLFAIPALGPPIALLVPLSPSTQPPAILTLVLS